MKLRFVLKSFESKGLIKVSAELRSLCESLDCKVAGVVALPIRIKKYCVLRSPHIDKDSREAFELRVHKHFIDIVLENSQVLDQLLKLEVPAGVLCSLQVLEN
jgi:small subunit ribosomal protein S10